MPSPPIQVFLTTIASQPALRQRQEYILRILQVKKIPFKSYDLASDEAAKKIWRRKAPAAKQQLPGMLVGGVCPGTYDDFEEAVEYDELDTYLRLKESWNEEDDYSPSLEVKPVGVPGASSPSQMTNQRPSFATAPSPLKDKSKAGEELDAGDLLEDNSLVGVSVTDDELADLVKELGLEGDEAGDLVKGLSSTREPEPELEPEPEPAPAPESQPEPETKPAPIEKKTDDETTVADNASDALENEPIDPRIVTIEVQSDRNLAKAEEQEK